MTIKSLDKIGLKVLPRVAWAYLWVVAATSRMTVHGAEHADAFRRRRASVIYAFWHNRQSILPLIRRDERIHCLVSTSRDGEYISRVLHLFDKETIRGSTTRGGFEAMKQIMQVLGSGHNVAVTPDGPLGPPLRVKPGVIQIAGATGCPIVPVAFDATPKKVFASWDGFCLPYPFARIAIVFGPALNVSGSDPVDDGCRRLNQALDDVTAEATRRVRGQWPTA